MFLTALWRAGTMGTPLPQIMASFVSSLGKKLAAREPNTGILTRDILSALTALDALVPGSLGKGKGFDCGGIWLAALDLNPENLLDACVCIHLGPIASLTPRSRSAAFANFVVVSLGSRKRDALLESETWDYLRDSLLLIFTRHYFCDEEPIALAVIPSVCFAMTCLFRAAAPQASESFSDSLFSRHNSDIHASQNHTC
jgi:hypothetical protein